MIQSSMAPSRPEQFRSKQGLLNQPVAAFKLIDPLSSVILGRLLKFLSFLICKVGIKEWMLKDQIQASC